MRLRRLAPGLSILAAILLLASGPGTRLGLWPFTVGLGMLAAAGVLGLIVVVVAVVLLFGKTSPVAPLLALLLGAVALSVPLIGVLQARSAPPIHDISTDTDKPPEFVALLRLRANAPNPPGYPGREVAEQQRRAYPDVRPILLETPPATAFSRARAAAEAMGWEIVAADPRAGRIEAVASTFWFGFKDDVVVRVTPVASGSRVDVRSKSRVGVSDAGTNAQRVRAYQKRLN